MKEYYSGTKEAVINDRPITFTIKANVMAEPLGTYRFLIYDDNLRCVKTSPYLCGELAIIDIGYRTCDYVVLNKVIVLYLFLSGASLFR